jgi:c-di-GMP-binding flagellar brake protein YcgR
MGLFDFLGLKKAPATKQLRAMLPSLHSFVDVSVRSGPKGSVCFEKSGVKTFVTSVLAGMAPGQPVSFSYQNTTGKYRFTTSVKAVDEKQASYDMPAKIDTVQKFGGSVMRTNVRIDTTVNVQWRYASDGRLKTEWQKGVLSDISRAGSSLAAAKAVDVGTCLELKIPLTPSGQPTLARADAKRVDTIANTSKYNVGLAFRSLSPDAERAVVDFINRRQTDLRNRGLG